MLNFMTDIKKQEYELLNEISQDSLVTQASLSNRLGIAIGSVNWYIKRLIKRGYVKVSHLDRTRLKYDLTPEGMSVFTERALQYAKDSLKVYGAFRQQAQSIVSKLQVQEITRVYLQGNDERMDILRLTCIEANILLSDTPCDVTLNVNGQGYQISYGK